MNCLHCGYCCINYLVPIVDKPELGLIETNIIIHNGDGTPCKHLKGNCPGEYECAIHNEEFYKETPCYDFSQVEQSNSNCRMGEYIISKLNKTI